MDVRGRYPVVLRRENLSDVLFVISVSSELICVPYEKYHRGTLRWSILNGYPRENFIIAFKMTL